MRKQDPTILERLARLEADMCWVKKMVTIDTGLLISMIIALLSKLLSG